MKAKADSWKREPFLGGVAIPYDASLTSSEFERLCAGLIPKQMEDKWFIYYEEPYLFLHRSWTGQPVFRVKLRASDTGAHVEEALVSWPQDPDVEYEAQLLDFLIANLLLGYSKPFPRPAGVKESVPGVLQHHTSGTGYAESNAVRTRSPSIVHGDITRMTVDAIVNAANEWMLGGGGVDGAIHFAAGPELLEACREIPEVKPGIRCPVGEARITPGFRLPAKHVIHTVGPRWHGGAKSEPELLASCYRACLALANEHQLKSVAFPAISTGAFAYPLLPACRIAVTECSAFLERDTSVSEIILVGFAKQDAAALRQALSELQSGRSR